MAAVETAARIDLRNPDAGRERLRERLFEGAMLLALLISLGVLLTLLFDILASALPLLAERGTGFVTAGLSSFPENAGVGQGIIGSLQIAFVTAVVAIPLGVATAIYLEEYAPDTWLTRFIDINIRNLAGVPSIVYGLLGFAIFVRFLGPRDLGGIVNLTGGRSALAGGLTLAILALPIVIITSAEAIRGVPRSLRDGGYGLGATRWDVTRQLVLPQALPGILTGTILSLARAIGETAPLLVVGAVTGFLSTGGASFFESLTQSGFTALPIIVFGWSRQPQPAYQDALAPAAILMLLLFTLSANALAIWLRNRYERRV